jgi:hypothetical protein
MLPPRTRLDPEGFYAILGLDPAAGPEAITAAFRRKAREVHPDVPGTGNTSAFVAARRAYDVLSNRERRASYDHSARQAAAKATEPSAAHPAARRAEPFGGRGDFAGGSTGESALRHLRRSGLAGLPVAVWIGLGAFLGFCVVEAGVHLRSLQPVASSGIRPNAAPIAPLSPSAQRAELYGPSPVRLAGTPNFYVVPALGAAVLWRRDPKLESFVPIGQLPPFSAVQALRQSAQTGLVEVVINEAVTGFVEGKRLTRGDAETAWRAYCEYNSGPAPFDGELLGQQGQGNGAIQLENRAIQPAVVKLRDASGAVALSVFLGPGGHAELNDLPEGSFRAEFAIGEFWSRACNTFAAGMRARRLDESVSTLHTARLVVPSDPEGAEISDQDFGRD